MVRKETVFRSYKDKTVLVTGDSGFKGSWLALWLVHLGARVIGYSLPPRTDRDNYAICGVDRHIIHTDGDVRDHEALIKVFSQYNPDMAFHLAAQALVLESYKDPSYTFHTNIMGTVNFLEAVRSTPSVKAAVVVTSDKCYENKEWIYGYRETDPIGGKDPYSASKGAAEIITSSYMRSYFEDPSSAHIASARAGNVIGGGDWAANRILPDCIRSLLRDKPIIIRNPSAIRPWQHVLEPLFGYLTLAASLYHEGRDHSAAWNFGPNQADTLSVRELVEKTIQYWGSGSYNIEQEPNASPEAGRLQLDISKAMSCLDWHPVMGIDKAIALSVEEYRISGSDTEVFYNQRLQHIQDFNTLLARMD